MNCLAGVPSVVFGLFGLGFFVVFMKFGSSILSGSLTLGILILPTIIGASEEALKAVPQTFREGLPGPGGFQVAHDLPDRPAVGPSRHPDRGDPGNRPCRGRDGAHHVHGRRLFHGAPAEVDF